jgi:hypothetical protein
MIPQKIDHEEAKKRRKSEKNLRALSFFVVDLHSFLAPLIAMNDSSMALKMIEDDRTRRSQ